MKSAPWRWDRVGAGDIVDGLRVGATIPNTGSISASLIAYEVLPGLRAVPMGVFEETRPTTMFYSVSDIDRVERLAKAIDASRRIDPLIVVVDQRGPYVLEGGHRLGALHLLQRVAFPAKVVIDQEST